MSDAFRDLVEAGRRANIEARRAQPARVGDARPEARPVELPCRIAIPWSLLISDNDRHMPALRQGKPIVLTASAYGKARNQISEIAARATNDGVPLAAPLQLVGRVYPPRATRVDPSNFAKLVQDALSKVVYADDRWLYRVVWERAEADVDRPRAEITLTEIPA